MGIHRDVAIATMKLGSAFEGKDFMKEAGLDMPMPCTDPRMKKAGALPAMLREPIPATTLHRVVDMVMVFGIGDFVASDQCSSYYDPDSPWYNVLYGAYGLQSYKWDGTAWGYEQDGSPNFKEFFEVPSIDYNFLMAGMLGCPPSKMSFHVKDMQHKRIGLWDVADVVADIPSGLHDPATDSKANHKAYLMYGLPPKSYFGGRPPYEKVAMRGQMYMRQADVPNAPYPITQSFGVLCPDTPKGEELCHTIMEVMEDSYVS